MWYEFLRFAHVIGACVLLGTGAGIAFFMVISNRSQDPTTGSGRCESRSKRPEP